MNRSAIMTAFSNLIFVLPQFKTWGRRLVKQSAIDAYPAVFVVNLEDTYERQAQFARVTMDVAILVYSNTGTAPDAVPADDLGLLVDAIEAALQPATPKDLQLRSLTLGGLVQHCWIEGKIEYYPADWESRAKAVIPAKILVP